MGCFLSTLKDAVENRTMPGNIGEVAVFVPGFRIPLSVDISHPLNDCLTKNLVEQLSALRAQVVVVASQETPTAAKSRKKAATKHGGTTLYDLQRALEDYLPTLLGLVKNGSQLEHKVKFVWINQEDDAKETHMSNAWYEVLSVIHLMAMLSLFQANLLLLPKPTSDGYRPKVSEENKRISIDFLLKATGYLDYAIQHVLPCIPQEIRNDLPVDLQEGVLQSLCLQALGQSVYIQLGIAIDSVKATLAVKRRLACEMVKYWKQAKESIMQIPVTRGWGEKHKLFVMWKHVEAKAAAYYYHGLILDEGNTEKCHRTAVAALKSAGEFLKESKKACEAFHLAPPTSRNPPLWGTTKFLSEIHREISRKEHLKGDLYSHEKIIESAPPLPDFQLALKPDEYTLPPVDPLWTHQKDRLDR